MMDVQLLVRAILSDVNLITPVFTDIVASYRLLVGAAEEIHRIPGLPPDVFQRAVNRFDHAGTLIDILLELLCCKITFSANVLSVTCAPVDIFKLAACTADKWSDPCLTLDQLLQIQLLKCALENYTPKDCCFPPESNVFPYPGLPNGGAAVPQPAEQVQTTDTDEPVALIETLTNTVPGESL